MQENNKLLLFSCLCKMGDRTEIGHYKFYLILPLSFFLVILEFLLALVTKFELTLAKSLYLLTLLNNHTWSLNLFLSHGSSSSRLSVRRFCLPSHILLSELTCKVLYSYNIPSFLLAWRNSTSVDRDICLWQPSCLTYPHLKCRWSYFNP